MENPGRFWTECSKGHSHPPNEWPRGANDFSATEPLKRSTLLQVQEAYCSV